MVKLTAIVNKGDMRLLLRFSDGSWGTCDFASLIAAGTEMTKPLQDPAFFSRCFIELGALAWPNGFDLSAASLHRRLEESGDLHRAARAV